MSVPEEAIKMCVRTVPSPFLQCLTNNKVIAVSA
uniref:Uncharacterized protein n=1 Tax=Anopheles quadriannulatus TaxID=34691 RepID=A0A182XQ63_ANOQN